MGRPSACWQSLVSAIAARRLYSAAMGIPATTASGSAETQSAWTAGPLVPPPLTRALHVWRADTAVVVTALGAPERIAARLPPNERARAARIAEPERRRDWLAAHAALRALLAGYLGLAALDVRLEPHEHG